MWEFLLWEGCMWVPHFPVNNILLIFWKRCRIGLTMRIIRMNCIFRICSNIRRICRIGAYSAATWPSLRLSLIGFRLVDFFLKKLLRVPIGSQIRHLWPRWPSPNVLACLNLKLTQGHPLVAKFSDMCHFRHFLRVPRKTWPKSKGLPWKI